MATMSARKKTELRQTLGDNLKSIRQSSGLTLQTAGEQIGLAASTISKIENGQMSPTYENLVRIAAGYAVDIEVLFAQRPRDIATARYAVTRCGEGERLTTDAYQYEMLCTAISRKQIIPIVAVINRTSFSQEDFTRHSGEEMVFVLSGRVQVHLAHYEKFTLDIGDCAYFDSSMGHALVSLGNEPARVLWTCTHSTVNAKSTTSIDHEE